MSSKAFDQFFQNLITEEAGLLTLTSKSYESMQKDIIQFFDTTLENQRKKLFSTSSAQAALSDVSSACSLASEACGRLPGVGLMLTIASITSLGVSFGLQHDIDKYKSSIIHDLTNAQTVLREKYKDDFKDFYAYDDARSKTNEDLGTMQISGNLDDIRTFLLALVMAVQKQNDGTVTVPLLKAAFKEQYDASTNDAASGYVTSVLNIHSRLYDIGLTTGKYPSEAIIDRILNSRMGKMADSVTPELLSMSLVSSIASCIAFSRKCERVVSYFNACRFRVAKICAKWSVKHPK